ncbi:Acetyltransferase (GNAT) family protein [Chitinophaga sp. CF118]|uniref:GNAT family N-acetyltransferase n=1 Tax=Chitinophaga sp. CF118 TaxID=1884367 RepID=UPI0008E0D232|nr:GNAT family N-acetyltransferase [Chitinophaga sp. CF118]SFE06919.1 Acetyltransferase (GNAT) family protein [Chitinophaga sp. CF118]
MSTIPPSEQSSLQNATPQQLMQATAFNHQELFCMNAMVVNGEIHTADGFKWTHAGSDNESMIAFPVLSADNADKELDKVMAYYLHHPPQGVGCWSLDPTQPSDLGVKLLARGFQPGWRPQWMSRDLDKININPLLPGRLEIRADSNAPIHMIKQLPYASLSDSGVNQAILNAFPERTQRFIALMDGQIIAQSNVLFSGGVAGIYNVGVVPSERNQGIGKAIVLATCQFAKERGYHYAVLNATGRRMYEKAGFNWMGNGWTWWLKTANLVAHPPTPAQIAIAEAIGTGNLSSLDDNADYSFLMTNGMTLMQLAVHCHQPASADWLASHMIPYTVLDAWDLGWIDRATTLLKKDPAQVNQQYGEPATTLLHIAVDRNDIPLAQLALSANPDLQIRDYYYNSTPLEWARHLHRTEIRQLIELH